MINLSADKSVQDVKIEWENSCVCPDIVFATIGPLKLEMVKYFKYCGKIKKLTGKMGSAECEVVDVDPSDS